MVKQAKDLNVLFYDTLRDIYFAEKQILRALPKMAKSTQSGELRQAFETHREQTEGHVERLEQISRSSTSRRVARPATRSTASSMKARRSWRSTPILTHSTRAFSPPRKPSSITKSAATAR